MWEINRYMIRRFLLSMLVDLRQHYFSLAVVNLLTSIFTIVYTFLCHSFSFNPFIVFSSFRRKLFIHFSNGDMLHPNSSKWHFSEILTVSVGFIRRNIALVSPLMQHPLQIGRIFVAFLTFLRYFLSYLMFAFLYSKLVRILNGIRYPNHVVYIVNIWIDIISKLDIGEPRSTFFSVSLEYLSHK